MYCSFFIFLAVLFQFKFSCCSFVDVGMIASHPTFFTLHSNNNSSCFFLSSHCTKNNKLKGYNYDNWRHWLFGSKETRTPDLPDKSGRSNQSRWIDGSSFYFSISLTVILSHVLPESYQKPYKKAELMAYCSWLSQHFLFDVLKIFFPSQ